jgi:hypothetical protein
MVEGAEPSLENCCRHSFSVPYDMTKYVEGLEGFCQASIDFSAARKIPCKVVAEVAKLIDRLDVL